MIGRALAVRVAESRRDLAEGGPVYEVSLDAVAADPGASATPTPSPSPTTSPSAGPSPSPGSDAQPSPDASPSSSPQSTQKGDDAPQSSPANPGLSSPDPDASEPTVEFSVDYGPFAHAGGGNWATRLRLEVVPNDGDHARLDSKNAAAEPLVESSNDIEERVVTAQIPQSVLADGPMTLALVTDDSGPEGDYAASPLLGSAQWEHGGSSGEFSWSYPVSAVPAIGGPEPDVDVHYSSANTDGRTGATNSQTSWLGEGFELGAGFVERSYETCKEDAGSGSNSPSGSKDVCWDGERLTMSLDGVASTLVRTDATSNEWRRRHDDGTVVTRLTGAGNGARDGEYWLATTPDGTRHYFGLGTPPGRSTTTGSVSTVPVFGDRAGEPCHASSFAASHCVQGWRWGEDYVVDTHDREMSYFYAQETNRYGLNNNSSSVSYDRASYLQRIEYGTTADHPEVADPARVMFTVAERCLPKTGVTCTTLDSAHADDWPDVPFDQICSSTSSCSNRLAPTFFTRKRLVAMGTQVLKSGAYSDVDGYAFVSEYPAVWGRENLWLRTITHTGYGPDAGSSSDDVTLPPTEFYGKSFPNRVNKKGDGLSGYYRYYMYTILHETGGRTNVCPPT